MGKTATDKRHGVKNVWVASSMDHEGGLTIYNVMFYVVIPGAVKTVEPDRM